MLPKPVAAQEKGIPRLNVEHVDVHSDVRLVAQRPGEVIAVAMVADLVGGDFPQRHSQLSQAVVNALIQDLPVPELIDARVPDVGRAGPALAEPERGNRCLHVAFRALPADDALVGLAKGLLHQRARGYTAGHLPADDMHSQP